MDNNKKILIVDDSNSMCRMLESMLHEAGYSNIQIVMEGKEALLLCAEEHPDLVLLDIIMPDVNGMEVLRMLKGKTKVIVISAVGQEDIVKEAKALGATDYLVKPLESMQVAEAVHRALK